MTVNPEIYPTTNMQVRWDIVISVDPSSAQDPRVQVNGVWYVGTWLNVATPVGTNWTRSVGLRLAGVDSDDAQSALVSEDDEPLVEVTIGTTKLVTKSTRRVVVKD